MEGTDGRVVGNAKLVEAEVRERRLSDPLQNEEWLILAEDHRRVLVERDATLAQLKAAEEERDRLRDDGVNASKMLVLMAAEIALGRQVSRMNGPGSALTSADIIVEFHKFAARKGHDSD